MTPPIRIAIDARELAGHVTGAGVYLLNILRHWLPRDDVRVSLIAHEDLSPDVAALPAFERATAIVRPDRTGGTLWEQFVLPRQVRATEHDVFFAPAYSAPLRLTVPSVLAVHDISFVAHPEWFRPRERMRRNAITPRAARRANRVVTISEFSAREIETRLGVSRAQIRLVPPGAPRRPATQAPLATREPLVVFAGSIFNRRHVPDLIAAFARAARTYPDARLIIAGANRTWPHEDIQGLIAASSLADRMTWLDAPSNAQIADRLSRASVFAFLSEYEGFAMTPFEALAFGVPPVLLDTPVAREVYGDAAVYVPRGDISATAAALARLLGDAPARQRLVDRAAPMWTRFDWARSAADLLQVMREAAS